MSGKASSLSAEAGRVVGAPPIVHGGTDHDDRGRLGIARPWQQEVAARSAIRVAYYRPGRVARKVAVPLLVLAYDDDGVTPPGPAVRAAQHAPRGELVRLPGGHYEAFMGGYGRALDALLSFLRRHLVQAFDENPATTGAESRHGRRNRRLDGSAARGSEVT